MPHVNAATAKQAHVHSTSTFATILPANTAVPISCDACDAEHEYAMSHLRALPELQCHNCHSRRHFSAFELNVLEKALNGMGYHLAKG